MLRPITRKSIFHSSPFIDNLIAGFQQSYSNDMEPHMSRDQMVLKKHYDHLSPFHVGDYQATGNCVIALRVGSRKEYIEQVPIQLKGFLNQLNIHRMYLLDFTRYSILTDFPFDNFTKRNRFKRLGGIKKGWFGYQFDTSDMEHILPLFFFSRVYDVPVIFFMSDQDSIPISLRLCDDGNFHLNYQHVDEKIIEDAAKNNGFAVGGTEICGKIFVQPLK